MVIASYPNSVAELAGFWALVLMLILLVGYLVRQSRRRARAQREEWDATVAVIPLRYRRPRQRWAHPLLGLALLLGLAGLSSLAPEDLHAVAFIGLLSPVMIALQLSVRNIHRRVIAGVSEEAPQMEGDELRELVEALEFYYGKAEMKPLRRQLPDRA